MHAFRAGLGVVPKGAWGGGGHAGCSTVADKVPLVEELDEIVFAMAGDGA